MLYRRRTLRAHPAPPCLRTAPKPGSPFRTLWPGTSAPSAVSPTLTLALALALTLSQELLLESARRELAACDDDEVRVRVRVWVRVTSSEGKLD